MTDCIKWVAREKLVRRMPGKDASWVDEKIKKNC